MFLGEALLVQNLVTIAWTVKKTVRAKLRCMVKRIGIFVAVMTALLLVVGIGRRRSVP
jgi:hypothetical protein